MLTELLCSPFCSVLHNMQPVWYEEVLRNDSVSSVRLGESNIGCSGYTRREPHVSNGRRHCACWGIITVMVVTFCNYQRRILGFANTFCIATAMPEDRYLGAKNGGACFLVEVFSRARAVVEPGADWECPGCIDVCRHSCQEQ